jgi:hypothetical protein
MKRSPFEKAFIALVFPVIIAFYFIYGLFPKIKLSPLFIGLESLPVFGTQLFIQD